VQSEAAEGLRVLIAGGGTGGHVIPGLAIARELRDSAQAEVRFVGTERGLETKLVPEAGFALYLIQVGQLKNVSLRTRVRTLGDLPLGILRCMKLLQQFKPAVVVGVGGYASGPAMMAAILLRIPTLAFEPNAVPGLANRLVGRMVSAAAVNFEQTTRYFRNAQVTGIPVRKEFFEVEPLAGGPVRSSLESPTGVAPRLLIFGGSQGARIFNEVMPRVARQLLDSVPGLTILHQAGGKNAEPTQAAYRASGADPTRWQVEPYLDDMPQRFEQASLILCRSGASTVAELAAAGRAAVLVPFPGAADNHQLRNAEAFQQAGAAQLRTQEEDALWENLLFSDLSALLLNPGLCARMGERARALAHPDAAGEIAGLCLELAGI
jgi:UDP-N-acetylglucosamine--N-acetylmuramyl-(pentapeptide) pyrophosphoryl-undecaprenol N-acetylglucosamine transferase